MGLAQQQAVFAGLGQAFVLAAARCALLQQALAQVARIKFPARLVGPGLELDALVFAKPVGPGEVGARVLKAALGHAVVVKHRLTEKHPVFVGGVVVPEDLLAKSLHRQRVIVAVPPVQARAQVVAPAPGRLRAHLLRSGRPAIGVGLGTVGDDSVLALSFEHRQRQ